MYALFLSLFILVAPLSADVLEKALYLKGSSDQGIILAHGKGMHPDFKVVKPLRIALHEDLDFHTLSLQMPINHKDYKDYEAEQEDVNAMINKAIEFLHAKGVKDVYLMGHSLGAGMTSAFLVKYPKSDIVGYIAVGCRANESKLISCNENMKKIDLNVFDAWGRANEKDEKYAKSRKTLVSERYTQYGIDGANHVLDGANEFFIDAVEGWLEEQ